MPAPPEHLVERFHEALVSEIRSSHPEYLSSPFTVAEIYQNLVPYRTHRDLIGVEINGDYEDALLRLLAGQGDYLILESETARRELQEELKSSNPNTGLYRDYAAADVRLNPMHTAEGAEGAEPTSQEQAGGGESKILAETEPGDEGEAEVGMGAEGEPEEATEEDVDLAEGEGPEAEMEAEVIDEVDEEEVNATPDPAEGEVAEASPSSCQWCSEGLPDRVGVKYCPHCGADLGLVPCASCGEELEGGWRFCVACGAEVEG